jgi:hypothetical protein
MLDAITDTPTITKRSHQPVSLVDLVIWVIMVTILGEAVTILVLGSPLLAFAYFSSTSTYKV